MTDVNLAYFLATITIHTLSNGFIKNIRETYAKEILQDIMGSSEKGESRNDERK